MHDSGIVWHSQELNRKGTPMKIEKLCCFCNHFCIDPGYPDESDVTPGEDTEIGCSGKGHWELDNSSKDYDEAQTITEAKNQ